ncbi:ATP-binding protein [Allochromatium palmeri]|uniref:Sensory/regulatory protein RpfC n=1 Tax=Allochromatium palmeri TaxID=231048 RepID=A0A6N8EH18_9GAMM|nr:response regulator [Allochromatium palmeri]
MTPDPLNDDIKRSEIRYRGLFENMISAAMVLSHRPDGFHIEAINAQCRQFAVLDIAGRSVAWLHEVIDTHESPELHAALKEVLEQGVGRHMDEFPLIRSGQAHWLDCHIFPLVADEIVLMIRDVTDQKLARDLRHAKEAAEQASELKSAFLASMSHEIRTPLNGVLSMVELLRGSRLNGRQRHWVEAIRGSGQLLLSTINDILDFSRIEAGRLQLDRVQFSLGEVIGNLFNATFQRAYAKQLELVIHQDPGLPDALIGDPFRLQQILVNLVGNAIKFTDQGDIEIRLTYRELPDDRLDLCVSVRDTGIGMGSEQIGQLFQPFEQIRANGWRFSEGTGLGLAICKRLVDAMDGEIGVESAPGKGSLFYFEVPVSRAEIGPPTSWLLPREWRCPTLVWIEHDLMRATATHLLSILGFEAEQTAEAATAFDWARDLEADAGTCLLMLDDAWLAHHGPRLVSALRTHEERATGRDRRVLVLYVVNVFARDRGELDRLDGMTDTAYAMKPLHLSALFNALQDLFGAPSRATRLERKSDDPSWAVLIRRLGAREQLSGARLLLAEDNPVNQQVATEALALVGIETRVVVNGLAAIEAIEEDAFDGVLMDVQMPLMDGLEATEIIRRRHDPDALPIIAMTAGVFFKDRQRSLQVGMNDHVGKPINMRNLLETLLKWIRPAHPRPFRSLDPERFEEVASDRLQLIEGELDWSRVDLPGIKVRKGLNRLGGNGLLYFKLLTTFVSLQSQGRETMPAALERADEAALRLQAHTLKGVAKTLGADALHAHAERVEQAAEAGERASLDALLHPMLDELQTVLDGVNAFLESWHLADDETGDGDLGARPDPEQAGDRHALIAALLEHGDTRLRDVCVDNRAYLRDWFGGEASGYAHFMALIEQYRFEEARRIFRERANPPDVTPETADRRTSA